jgi:hypothetical protein
VQAVGNVGTVGLWSPITGGWQASSDWVATVPNS